MPLKDILVIVDEAPACLRRVDAAAALAARHDAHLTGLYIITPLTLPSYIDAQLPEEVRESHRLLCLEQAARAKEMFEARMADAGLTGRSEWRVGYGEPTDLAALHARYADLVVVGQIDPALDLDAPVVIPEDLVFDCGRPVLIVPYVGQFACIGKRVMVAWNASREAARAVADATPILTRARKVTILAVDPRWGRSGQGEQPGADVATHLAHHGVVAEAMHVAGSEIDVASTVLNHVTDLGCDLIVMGAYGQSRVKTLVLGSLTDAMLRHMTVPTLMCH